VPDNEPDFTEPFIVLWEHAHDFIGTDYLQFAFFT
jgi:hypothetical protein